MRITCLPLPLGLVLTLASAPASASASAPESARAPGDPTPVAEPRPADGDATPGPREQASARPGAPSLDEVRLRGGGIVRGTILDLQPEVSVTIQRAADGTSITYAWAEVISADLAPTTAQDRAPAPARTDASPPPAATPKADPFPPAPESGRGMPRLTIKTRSRRPVHIFTTGDSPVLMATTSANATTMTTTTALRGGVALRSVCQAPCGEVIDARAGYPYFFGGDRMPISRPVYLNYAEGDVTAEVRPGRFGFLIGGIFGISYGAVGALTGGALLGVAPDTLARPGGILLGTGTALLVSGIVMVIHGRTRYRIR